MDPIKIIYPQSDVAQSENNKHNFQKSSLTPLYMNEKNSLGEQMWWYSRLILPPMTTAFHI